MGTTLEEFKTQEQWFDTKEELNDLVSAHIDKRIDTFETRLTTKLDLERFSIDTIDAQVNI
jgi:hypothetical protein